MLASLAGLWDILILVSWVFGEPKHFGESSGSYYEESPSNGVCNTVTRLNTLTLSYHRGGISNQD